jgi:hydrogenase expression/formation protein HypD
VKHVDAFRDPVAARRLAEAIHSRVHRPWTVMEVCGGQTHSIVRFGIDRMLPDGLSLLHGPGCPVCVTPTGIIDQALALAARPDVIVCSFGDMLRVPGSTGDLVGARTAGADVRVVWSPLDALEVARSHPDRQVVFFAVGFETTAPAVAMAVHQAAAGVDNLSFLVAHVLVPPAVEAIASDPARRVHGFLAAGHVCAVMGVEEYHPLAARHRVPIVVTGFEPVDLLQGLLQVVTQLEEGRHEVENAYRRTARDDGNKAARTMVERVFEVVPRAWRGMGVLQRSGLALRAEYHHQDAVRRFGIADLEGHEDPRCRAGDVLRGLLLPAECPEFGRGCNPERPLGAPMVSAEGACAAFYRFRRAG